MSSITRLPRPSAPEIEENVLRARAAAESMGPELAVVLLDLPPRTPEDAARDVALEVKDAAARAEPVWTPYETEDDEGFVRGWDDADDFD